MRSLLCPAFAGGKRINGTHCVVIREWVIEAGLSLPAEADRRRRDDPFDSLRLGPRRRDTDALLPESQVPEDALGKLPHVLLGASTHVNALIWA